MWLCLTNFIIVNYRIQEKKRQLKRPSDDVRYDIERKRSSREESSRSDRDRERDRDRRFEAPPPPRFDGPITSSTRYILINLI